MAISVKHKFASAKSDGADSTLIQPSNWNDEHDLLMATARLLGRTTAGAGVAEEISVGSNLTLSAGSLAVRPDPTFTSIDTGSIDAASLLIGGAALTATPAQLNALGALTISAFAQTLLDDANAAAARATLGVAAAEAWTLIQTITGPGTTFESTASLAGFKKIRVEFFLASSTTYTSSTGLQVSVRARRTSDSSIRHIGLLGFPQSISSSNYGLAGIMEFQNFDDARGDGFMPVVSSIGVKIGGTTTDLTKMHDVGVGARALGAINVDGGDLAGNVDRLSIGHSGLGYTAGSFMKVYGLS